jgi:lactoylglutathione lyase
MTTGEPTRSRFDHVGLDVADLEAMERWYTSAFGYRVQLRFELADIDLRIVMLVVERGHRLQLL